jgi:hypothetical protein
MQSRRNAIYVLLILSLLTGLFTGRTVFFNLAYVLGGLLLFRCSGLGCLCVGLACPPDALTPWDRLAVTLKSCYGA